MFHRNLSAIKAKLEHQGYYVVMSSDVPRRVYAIQLNNQLGEGSYGSVYQAYHVNTQTGLVDLSQPLAVKLVLMRDLNFDKKIALLQEIENEIRIQNAYYPPAKLITSSCHYYIFMSYLPGEDLFQFDDNILKKAEMLKTFSFEDRLTSLTQIALQVNLFHHHTPTTHEAICHGDLKGENIRISKQSGVLQTYIYDFGLSDSIISLEKAFNKNNKTTIRGTPIYMPKESVNTRGTFTDIFSLTPVFALILGADNPFSKRSEADNFDDVTSLPFVYDDLLVSRIVPASKYIDMKRLLFDFLNRMQHDDFRCRPSSDNVLRFCNTLRLHWRLENKKDLDVDDQDQLFYYERELNKLTDSYKDMVIEDTLSFDNIGYHASPDSGARLFKSRSVSDKRDDQSLNDVPRFSMNQS